MLRNIIAFTLLTLTATATSFATVSLPWLTSAHTLSPTGPNMPMGELLGLTQFTQNLSQIPQPNLALLMLAGMSLIVLVAKTQPLPTTVPQEHEGASGNLS